MLGTFHREDQKRLEKVRRRATRMVRSLREMSYVPRSLTLIEAALALLQKTAWGYAKGLSADSWLHRPESRSFLQIGLEVCME